MHIAALDISGTKTIAAILDEKGVILAQENFASVVAGDEIHLELCVQALKRLLQQLRLEPEDFAGLGVSLPGIVDHKSGVLVFTPYVSWKNVAVAEYFITKLGISKVWCENEDNACAIGEQRFGIGRKYTDFVWMKVSTKVSGAVVEGSRLVRGGHGFAGELGHLKVEYKAPEYCSCGQYGCLDAHGSGSALIREIRKHRLESPVFAKDLKGLGLRPDAAGCTALAKTGNVDALTIFDQIGTFLGRGISYCINILNTQAIVIGGDAVAVFELLHPTICDSVQRNAFRQMQAIDIIKTPLGNDAALLGATALVLEHLEQ